MSVAFTSVAFTSDTHPWPLGFEILDHRKLRLRESREIAVTCCLLALCQDAHYVLTPAAQKVIGARHSSRGGGVQVVADCAATSAPAESSVTGTRAIRGVRTH